jgi:hypothetical protein
VDVDETTGAPGWVYDLVFGENESVPTFNLYANFLAWYDGNIGHTVKLQQWNYTNTQWDNVTVAAQDFQDEVSEQSYQFTLLASGDYISGGEIQLRVNHSSPGNVTHQFHLNQVYLSLTGSPSPSVSPSISPSASLSPSASVSPSASPSPSPAPEAVFDFELHVKQNQSFDLHVKQAFSFDLGVE